MSDTPRTDAIPDCDNYAASFNLATKLSRELERENAQLRADYHHLVQLCKERDAELELLRASANIADVLRR